MNNSNMTKKILLFLTIVLLFPMSLVHASTVNSDAQTRQDKQVHDIYEEEPDKDSLEESNKVTNSDIKLEDIDLDDAKELNTQNENKQLSISMNGSVEESNGVFDLPDGNQIIPVQNVTSNNGQSRLSFIWQIGETVYFAVNANFVNHDVQNMRIKIATKDIDNFEAIGPHLSDLIVDGTGYPIDYKLKGNTEQASWYIIKIPKKDLPAKLSGTRFTFDFHGGGHHIDNALIELDIPKGKITGKKEWRSKKNSVISSLNLLLKRALPNNSLNEIESKKVNSGNDWSVTWVDQPVTDDYGVSYIYSVDEKVVPVNYHKTISPPKKIAKSQTTTFTVRNTFKEITVIKTAERKDNWKLGDQVSYTYKITNTGDISVELASIFDDKIGEIQLEETILLNPGDFREVTAEYTVNEDDMKLNEDLISGTITNEVGVTGYVYENGTRTDSEVTASDNETIEISLSADLTIKKKVNGDYDDQVFVFTVEGDDISFSLTIPGNEAVVIKDLPLGEYTVTEDTGWSWRYDLEHISLANGKVNLDDDTEIIFTNRKVTNKWLSGFSDVLDNIFGESRLIVGGDKR